MSSDGENQTMEFDQTALAIIAKPLAPSKLHRRLLKLVRKAGKDKSLKRGVPGDVSPIDVLTHIPVLCEEANIPYAYLPSKVELGAAGSTRRPTCCVMIPEPKSGTFSVGVILMSDNIELSEEQKLLIQTNMERARRLISSKRPLEDTVQQAAVNETITTSRRGGFLHPSQPDSTLKDTREARRLNDDIIVTYPLEGNATCRHCTSIELDAVLKTHFSINVCHNCREIHSNNYRLLTKTTVKDEYLLTDEELADTSVLPFMTKPNPYKSTWSDMQLYLSMHVEKFAVKKWGSLEALQQEITRRESTKEARKEKKFKEKLKELRLKTRSKSSSALSSRASRRHVHCFEIVAAGLKRCTECQLEVEEEDI
ncbi:DNA repair protein [Paramicrosporidium saccamoebae]|uniref:DNA repair protein n=1 Tax=Paramicrosporidium saccamoebae TaxID=1246581 RepID=A0A2H9TP00_9FUNG|nr:DNA repair protein [Paramicrosporidium saccamoebae]